jgi:hypothetical protein
MRIPKCAQVGNGGFPWPESPVPFVIIPLFPETRPEMDMLILGVEERISSAASRTKIANKTLREDIDGRHHLNRYR